MKPQTFRVMTYNIHHGEGLDGKVDLLRIADLIKHEGADIVALQEVDRGVKRTQGRDLPEELAALTGMSCVFSNNYPFQGGEYGNAVLTRFPVLRSTNSHFHMLRAAEQRGMLQLILDIHGRRVAVFDTHLHNGHDDTERWSSIAEIQKIAESYHDLPLLLCGDFNDPPDSRVAQKLGEWFADAWAIAGTGDGWTIPANAPNRRIDYVWISQDKSLVPLKAWVPRSEASDHVPVVVEFEIARQPALIKK